MKRIMIISAILLVAVGPVFAQGAGEVLGGIFSGGGAGMATGAAIGSIIPGIGTAIGAIAGGIVGALSGGLSGGAKANRNQAQQQQLELQRRQTYQDAYTSAKDIYDQSYGNYQDTLTSITQSRANIDTYDQALMRWGDQYDIGLNQIQMQGEADYRQLMGNFSAQSQINAQTGQSGGTADLLARQRRDQVATLVGQDLRLDAEGGTYGTQLREYDLDMNAEFDQLVEQREIELDALSKSMANAEKYRAEVQTAQDNLKKAAEDYTDNVEGGKALKMLDALEKAGGLSGVGFNLSPEKIKEMKKKITDNQTKLLTGEDDVLDDVGTYERSADTDEEIEKLKRKLGRA